MSKRFSQIGKTASRNEATKLSDQTPLEGGGTTTVENQKQRKQQKVFKVLSQTNHLPNIAENRINLSIKSKGFLGN